jgi:hypothetical protein
MNTKTTRKPKSKAPAKKAAQKREWKAWFYASPEDKKALDKEGGCGPIEGDCIILRRGPATTLAHWRMIPVFLATAPGTQEGYAEDYGIVSASVGVISLMGEGGRFTILAK